MILSPAFNFFKDILDALSITLTARLIFKELVILSKVHFIKTYYPNAYKERNFKEIYKEGIEILIFGILWMIFILILIF